MIHSQRSIEYLVSGWARDVHHPPPVGCSRFVFWNYSVFSILIPHICPVSQIRGHRRRPVFPIPPLLFLTIFVMNFSSFPLRLQTKNNNEEKKSSPNKNKKRDATKADEKELAPSPSGLTKKNLNRWANKIPKAMEKERGEKNRRQKRKIAGGD